MPLLSLLDDRSKPKGSRDPLGFELVWSTLGRNVIGNLTTITSSLENFTTALLGFYWANELASESEPTARNKQIREYFLRYEQVAAYLRRIGQSNAIMGINRVSQRMNEQNKIAIGTGKEQITFDGVFDAFPMFSNDGKRLIFSSNRNNGGTRETNLFVAAVIE